MLKYLGGYFDAVDAPFVYIEHVLNLLDDMLLFIISHVSSICPFLHFI